MAISLAGLTKGVGLKFYVGLALVLLLLGYAGYNHFRIGHLESEVASLTKKNTDLVVDNTVLTKNNVVLKDQVAQLSLANSTNYETAKKLVQERETSKTAVAALAANNKRDKEALDRLNAKMIEMLQDPKNDGEVAPVLRELVREIQNQRSQQ